MYLHVYQNNLWVLSIQDAFARGVVSHTQWYTTLSRCFGLSNTRAMSPCSKYRFSAFGFRGGSAMTSVIVRVHRPSVDTDEKGAGIETTSVFGYEEMILAKVIWRKKSLQGGGWMQDNWIGIEPALAEKDPSAKTCQEINSVRLLCWKWQDLLYPFCTLARRLL